MKVLSKLNETLKSMMHFMILIAIVLGIANLLYINKVENELAESKKGVVSVGNKVDQMTTKVPGRVRSGNGRVLLRTNLHDILDRIEDAEDNIRNDLDTRFR